MRSLDTSPADPGLPVAPVHRNRRRRVRHKVQTPAYACLNPNAEQALDLCEIVDISEAGMAIQAFSPLVVGRDESFSLDLPETGAFVQTSGRVVWSEPSGRTGICFPETAGESLSVFREWLFANVIAGVASSAEELHSEVTVQKETPANAGIHTDIGLGWRPHKRPSRRLPIQARKRSRS